MTADQGPDQGRQRTVAELLEQYGDGGRGGSRRRRRADDDEPAEDTGERISAADLLDRDQTRGSAVPQQRWASGAGSGQSVDPLTGEPIDPDDRPDRGGAVAATGSAPIVPPPVRAGRPDRTDPPTEQLPRYPESDRDAGPLTGPMTGPLTGPMSWSGSRGRTDPGTYDDGTATGQMSRADVFDDDEQSGLLAGAAPAGLATRDDRGEFTDRDEARDAGAEEDSRPLGVKGWLQLVGQWVVGAVLGALLWVGFSYLWTHHPVIALVVAVLATAGLVLLVRAIRRSDDLQTTMLAVLVGLVVTISPAVLLLAGR